MSFKELFAKVAETVGMPELADLSGADLRDMDFRNADLRDMDLSGANLEGVDLTGADITGANLSGANLRGANLTDVKTETFGEINGVRGTTNLSGADLEGATLPGNMDIYAPDAKFKNATILPSTDRHDGAGEFAQRFVGNFEGADFSGVTANGVAFGGDFEGADFSNAKFGSTAAFTSAILEKTDFTNAEPFHICSNTSGAIGLETIEWPSRDTPASVDISAPSNG